jgi:ATP-binding cassette subfamily B protein
MRFFDKTPVGRLITELTSDVEALGDVFFLPERLALLVTFFLWLSLQLRCFLAMELAVMLILMLVPVTALIVYFQQQYRQTKL